MYKKGTVFSNFLLLLLRQRFEAKLCNFIIHSYIDFLLGLRTIVESVA